MRCGKTTEVFSRVSGYHRPVKNWNKGKQEEFKDRVVYEKDKMGYCPHICTISLMSKAT